MLLAITFVLCGLSSTALLFCFYGMAAMRRHLREAARQPGSEDRQYPPVSLIKPMKGLEEGLEENLRSFFEQEYAGPREYVFSSTEAKDPGMDLAARVAADYPDLPARFVHSDPDFGLNPKVSNLVGAIAATEHDLLLHSDANVRVNGGYLRRVVDEMRREDASLLTSLVVGTGERSMGAAMENLQLTAFIAPAMCTALYLAKVPCVVGKAMLFRKAELQALGGLDLVKNILAEDYVLGERYQEAGKRVVLSANTVCNVNERTKVSDFLARHSRWLQMRAVIHVGAFVADILANPTALAVAACLLSGFDPRVVAFTALLATLKVMADAYTVNMARGTPMRPRHLLIAPAKDVLMGAVWLYSGFSRTVTWRGRKLRIGRGSRLLPEGEPKAQPSRARGTL